MKLDNSKQYTSCMLRVYEEDYSDFDLMSLVHNLENESFKILCCKHSKDGVKTHYHILCIRDKHFRPSLIKGLGLLDHELSDVSNRKGSYFYIKEHRGVKEDKKLEDLEKHHLIEVIYDTIEYKDTSRSDRTPLLSDFIFEVDKILKETPHTSKFGLLKRLQYLNPSYLGLYLRYYRFVEEMYGQALFEISGETNINVDDIEDNE